MQDFSIFLRTEEPYKLEGGELRDWLEYPNPNAFTLANNRWASLVNLDLSGQDLSNTNLTQMCLKGAICINTDFSNAILNQTSLLGANLFGAKFVGAKIDSSNLRGAYLFRADFTDAEFGRHVNIESAQIKGLIPGDNIIRTFEFPECACYRINDVFYAHGNEWSIDEWKNVTDKELMMAGREKLVRFYHETIVKLLDL